MTRFPNSKETKNVSRIIYAPDPLRAPWYYESAVPYWVKLCLQSAPGILGIQYTVLTGAQTMFVPTQLVARIKER